jgi:hypothetical protein
VIVPTAGAGWYGSRSTGINPVVITNGTTVFKQQPVGRLQDRARRLETAIHHPEI